jgi:hypothetical protein
VPDAKVGAENAPEMAAPVVMIALTAPFTFTFPETLDCINGGTAGSHLPLMLPLTVTATVHDPALAPDQFSFQLPANRSTDGLFPA